MYQIHARIQEFSSGLGGGGCPGPSAIKNLRLRFLLFFDCFVSPQFILQKYNGLFQGSRGGFNIFSRGGVSNIFAGGVQLLIPERSSCNLCFSRGF